MNPLGWYVTFYAYAWIKSLYFIYIVYLIFSEQLVQPSVPGGIPGRLIREMLQFGLETAEKLPAILYRKIFYYIITENILYLLGLCYLFFQIDTPLDSLPSSIQGTGYVNRQIIQILLAFKNIFCTSSQLQYFRHNFQPWSQLKGGHPPPLRCRYNHNHLPGFKYSISSV